ncbi:alpha/beta fold hydrolase [Alcanivoracaceae bacterium MT1]
MNEARSVHIDNRKGYAVPVTWVAGGGPVFLVMGALGVAAPFYDKLVAELAARGWSVALMEQRGLGSSALRPSRRHNWGFRDVVEDDVPAVLDWIAKEAPRQPVYLFGHSLGGHYAAMCAGLYPQRFEGIVMCACGSPWITAYQEADRRRVQRLTRLIPLCHLLFGYYPGDRLGFGGREARGVMSDWRHLALTNRYRVGADDRRVDQALADYTGPALMLRMENDPFASAIAVDSVLRRFQRHRPEEQVLSAGELNDKADHFRWARRPAAVVARLARWLEADQTGPAGVVARQI